MRGEFVVVDFLEHRLDALVVDQHDVLEDEHQATDLLDQVRVVGLQALEDALLRRAVARFSTSATVARRRSSPCVCESMPLSRISRPARPRG
jgi:hypothetical protein